MQSTIILRGEEWLPSTPLHFELAQALGITPFRYAHTPVISIVDPSGGGKRKLSKRKDPEADVAFWQQAAYPLESIKAYLMGLANSNYEDWRVANPDSPLIDFPFSLDKLASSRSPLLDMKKLENYAKDDIARMPQEHFNKQVLAWTDVHNHELYIAMMSDADYTVKVLSIEREGDKPRKDIAMWSEIPIQFGYFYDEIFNKPDWQFMVNEGMQELPEDDQKEILDNFLKYYDHSADKETWFENLKKAAEKSDYALDRKDLKENPNKYKGGLADFATIIRVKLTGKSRTPDLWTIMQTMGEDRVRNRLA
jgi:glutamyl-tRNA synthetase